MTFISFMLFWYACIFFGVIPYWDSLFDGWGKEEVTEQTYVGGEDTGDSFINAAMFQDME
tara:strand:- start:219 stop:398 length:180 start_codon:yes stop_codon:yes gene_type:complete